MGVEKEKRRWRWIGRCCCCSCLCRVSRSLSLLATSIQRLYNVVHGITFIPRPGCSFQLLKHNPTVYVARWWERYRTRKKTNVIYWFLLYIDPNASMARIIRTRWFDFRLSCCTARCGQTDLICFNAPLASFPHLFFIVVSTSFHLQCCH